MRTIYTVRNIAGGSARFAHLADAMRAATGQWGDGYVHTRRGARPVCGEHLGDYGQEWDDLYRTVQDDDEQAAG